MAKTVVYKGYTKKLRLSITMQGQCMHRTWPKQLYTEGIPNSKDKY